MSEAESTEQGTADDGAPIAQPFAGGPTGDDEMAAPPADDGTDPEPEQQVERGHVSSVTDLPEGAEVDPLTDARPQPVEEAAPESDGQ